MSEDKPIIRAVLGEPYLSRFWANVKKTETCWLWTAHVNRRGYGQFMLGSLPLYPHRLAYEMLVGRIPAGLQLDHLCRVRHCLNPSHLEPVTCRENLRRGQTTSSQTHCKRGHDLAKARVTKTGARRCRICDLIRIRKFYAKRKARSR